MRGWRQREPVSDELVPEHVVLSQSIAESMLERGLNPDEIATMAGFSADSENTLFRPKSPLLRIV
jgi:hypothetical protein